MHTHAHIHAYWLSTNARHDLRQIANINLFNPLNYYPYFTEDIKA